MLRSGSTNPEFWTFSNKNVMKSAQFKNRELHFQGLSKSAYWGGCHAPVRPYAPVSKPDLLDEGRVPRGVQGRAGA